MYFLFMFILFCKESQNVLFYVKFSNKKIASQKKNTKQSPLKTTIFTMNFIIFVFVFYLIGIVYLFIYFFKYTLHPF